MKLDIDFDEIESQLKTSAHRCNTDLVGYTLIHKGPLYDLWCNGKRHIEVWSDGNAVVDCDCEFWSKLNDDKKPD